MSEVKKLRQGIREHRDSATHELCWHHPALWGLLPEQSDPLPTVPAWPEFMEGCIQYRRSLDQQLPDAPRTRKPFQDSVSKKETFGLVLINPFEVPKGLEEEALAYWERCADVLRRHPGFMSTRLHRAITPDARFALINVAEWSSADQFYEAVSQPEFQAVAVEDAKKYPHSRLCMSWSGVMSGSDPSTMIENRIEAPLVPKQIEDLLRSNFDFRPAGIVKQFGLRHLPEKSEDGFYKRWPPIDTWADPISTYPGNDRQD